MTQHSHCAVCAHCSSVGNVWSYYQNPETGDQCFTVCYRVKSWKPCGLRRLTSTLYTVVMVLMTSAQPWHLLLEMLCWQGRCVAFPCNSAPTSAAAAMWCTITLLVLVLLLSVALGVFNFLFGYCFFYSLHVCISLHHTAIAKGCCEGCSSS